MRPDHPLARRRVVPVAEAVRYPLAVGDRGVTARQLFDQACSLQGLQYRAIFVSNFSSALLPLLRTPDLMLSGLLTVMHLIEAGAVVARPFAEAPLQQRQLQVLALVEHLVRAIANAARRRLGRARGAAAPA